MIEEIQGVTDEELVENAGGTVVGTPSGLKAQHAQAELTRRLINAMKKLDSTTASYSKILIFLTLVLVFFTIFQIIISLFK